ncbi:hypothetical protein CLAFUW4_04561 [Fulvia fulva]|uniref:Uncharacterized protein n=1 Tax=Passalora fulva TaxID=5499 RepID=A0A9Q8LEP1_PASFU|nr:uncharacterized protein CLAFUR5_04523 [Fulvia fulva]KAK4627114.1 hypothetical protein CLAFUR4_04547 [Fulvia fulva]KAK4628238.1 hypothetical protein CLAFUR0_04550 [Fulvia fulva]UJO16023.1 hypothetical protein CLAFUR5_04523 [Fulvia fulva]WPV13618.1 hypothetical protein CLAFUW4_04561 [Fulvia fulva]WPV28100.1 hypothetical protein CLAFUW7_04553 [Fulvia fulva]
MSAEYKGQDPIDIAKQAERDLNTQQAKGNVKDQSSNLSDSARESGVNEDVISKFPGSTVQIGGQGAGDNRQIPLEEGGSINPGTGKPTKAGDFEGVGGPEDKARIYADQNGGDDAIRGNIRQGGETIRPGGGDSNASQGGTGGRTA